MRLILRKLNTQPIYMRFTSKFLRSAGVSIQEADDRISARTKGGSAHGYFISGNELHTYLTDLNGDDVGTECVFILGMLKVDQTVRRQGVGSELVTAILRAAKERGAGCCLLTASPNGGISQQQLERFYTSLGFTRYARTVFFNRERVG